MATRKTTSKKSTSTSSRSKTSTTKSSTTKSSAATTAPKTTTSTTSVVAKAATVPAEAVSDAVSEAQAAGPLRKRELFNRVKARAAGVKGSDVRLVMDALLDELGTALVDGISIDARPLGKLRVQKHRPSPAVDVVVCKLRRKKPATVEKDPLAEAAE